MVGNAWRVSPAKSHLRRHLLFGVTLILVWLGAVGVTAMDWRTLDWDGIDRVYGIYTPIDVQAPAPLVFLLHGGGGSALKTWNQDQGRSWQALADEHGFMLILPEGLADDSDGSAHHWNDCRTEIRSDDVSTGADDVGLIVALIENVAVRGSVDRTRVYVTGASNGGMMTYRLAMEAGEHFAAAAAVIANLPDPSECEDGATPVPMLIMNGTADPLIPFGGGCVASALCRRGRVMSTLDTIATWVNINGASSRAIIEPLPDVDPSDGSTVTIYRFNGGPEGADVVYYHVKGGGHQVPGFEAVSHLINDVVGPKNQDIDGPAEIWRFFGQRASRTVSISLR